MALSQSLSETCVSRLMQRLGLCVSFAFCPDRAVWSDHEIGGVGNGLCAILWPPSRWDYSPKINLVKASLLPILDLLDLGCLGGRWGWETAQQLGDTAELLLSRL